MVQIPPKHLNDYLGVVGELFYVEIGREKGPWVHIHRIQCNEEKT